MSGPGPAPCGARQDVDAYGDPFSMRLCLLDSYGQPVHTLGGDAHHAFLKGSFKRFVLRADLLEQAAHAWTCCCPWSDTMTDKPVFLTPLLGSGINKTFTSATWQDAQDKHRRISEKARRVLPLTPLPRDKDEQ